jgi:hypothetical protein
VVVYTGGAFDALDGRNMVCGDVLEFFFVLLDEYILVPQDIMQFLLVVFSKLFLVLHLILIHFPKLGALGLFVIEVGDESVDTLPGVAGAVLALILMHHVLVLHHIPEGVHLQLRVLQLLQELPLLRLRLVQHRLQLAVLLH